MHLWKQNQWWFIFIRMDLIYEAFIFHRWYLTSRSFQAEDWVSLEKEPCCWRGNQREIALLWRHVYIFAISIHAIQSWFILSIFFLNCEIYQCENKYKTKYVCRYVTPVGLENICPSNIAYPTSVTYRGQTCYIVKPEKQFLTYVKCASTP